MKNRLREIANAYDPEFDVPSGPPVTWAEMALTNEVTRLQARCEQLEARIERLDDIIRTADKAEE